MKPFRFLPAVLAGPAVLLLSAWAQAVVAPDSAPTCGSGPACGFGFECQVIGTSGCDPTPSCAPGASCPEPTPCAATEEYGCAPAHCQANGDCAAGMVCHEWTEPCASSGCACAPGQKCDCAEPIPCEPQTVSLCTPRYLLPCEVAADCGPGFSCEETQSCGCSGSGSAPSAGSGAAPLPPSTGGAGPESEDLPAPPDCSCEPSGVKQCVAQQLACESDASCPAGWTCEPGDIATTPACDGGDCKVAEPAPSTPTCRPPYYGGVRGDDSGAPVVPEAGGDGTGTPNDGAPTTGAPGAGESSPESNQSSACQFGVGNGRGGALSLLALMGALFGLARRRRVN